MGELRRWLLAISMVILSGLALSACGGDGSSSSVSSAGGSATGEPSAAFAGKGRNGELATAGTESSVPEREAASDVLEANLVARDLGDYVGQCETLAPELAAQIEQGPGEIPSSSCKEVLKAMAERARPSQLENPMVEPLAALRVNGNLAFAFFHGAEGKDYVMPMQKVGGEWKVASLNTQRTP